MQVSGYSQVRFRIVAADPERETTPAARKDRIMQFGKDLIGEGNVILNEDTAQEYVIGIVDIDSMSPAYPRGTVLEFEAPADLVIGEDYALMDEEGNEAFRRLESIEGGAAVFTTLDPGADKLRVLLDDVDGGEVGVMRAVCKRVPCGRGICTNRPNFLNDPAPKECLTKYYADLFGVAWPRKS